MTIPSRETTADSVDERFRRREIRFEERWPETVGFVEESREKERRASVEKEKRKVNVRRVSQKPVSCAL